MAFRCMQCHKDALEIVRTIELAPDLRSDEITLQVVACQACKFRGLAVYQESRRGRLDEDAWEHICYPVTETAVEQVMEQIGTCPNPGQRSCNCPVHLKLGRQDQYGAWIVLDELRSADPFPMRMPR